MQDGHESLGTTGQTVVGRIVVPKHACVPIPGTCEHVTLHGIRNFADVIRDKDLEMRLILDYLGGPNVITGSL